MYSTCLVALALIGGSGSTSLDDRSYASIDAAVGQLTPMIQTGTVLATRGDCLAVKVFTQSGITHVAAVVMNNGKPSIYDSANGVGVRCVSLPAYLKSQGPGNVHVYNPMKPFTKTRSKKFENYLKSQLGRPYAVKHHLTGNRSKGLHCAELMTDAFMSCRMIKANNPSRVSPASLVAGMTRGKIYKTGQTVSIAAPKVYETPSATWYGRAWQVTRQASSTAYNKTKSWVICE
jgi:hypothetical protein